MSPENDRDSQRFKLPYFATKEAIFPNRVGGRSRMSLDAQRVGLLLL